MPDFSAPMDAALTELADTAAELADLRRLLGSQDPLQRLQTIHEMAAVLAVLRGTFADLKGLAAVEANAAGSSYPKIAAALDCSEPYVQQMIYRGRKVGA